MNDLRDEINNQKKEVSILVHCSAGVGRTGTFIALYQLMEALDLPRGNTTEATSLSNLTRKMALNREIDIYNTVYLLN